MERNYVTVTPCVLAGVSECVNAALRCAALRCETQRHRAQRRVNLIVGNKPLAVGGGTTSLRELS